MPGANPNFLGNDQTTDLGDPWDSQGVKGGPHHKASLDVLVPALHSSDSPLHKAAYKGDVALLASLISSCETIDARNYFDCTPLHFAIRGNHAEAVSLLLSAGADPSLEDTVDEASFGKGLDAVYLAVWTGAQHAMVALIDAGLKIPASAFERCASLNFVDCMETIFDKLPEADFSDRSRIAGVRSALQRAACCWHLEAVDFLLTRVTGFPDENTPEDQTVLGQALASADDLEFICIDECRQWPNTNPERWSIIKEKLIAAGADVDVARNEAFWSAFDDSDAVKCLLENGLRHDRLTQGGHTPLFGLVSAGNHDIGLVEAFIAGGADVNQRDGVLRTPMHYAANQSIAEMLYRHGADLFAEDKSGMTPLHMACKNGCLDVIKFLLSKGAAVDEAATAGRTPLFYITFCGQDECEVYPFAPIFAPCPYVDRDGHEILRLEVAKSLLDHGANINAATADGQTVLHGAAQLGDTELMRFLVEHGANVRAIAANGDTPLHDAARQLSIEAVRYLIDQGANAHAVTTEGETVVHAACAMAACGKNNPAILAPMAQIVETFLDRGVDVNAKDSTGSTVLHLLYEQCYRSDRGYSICRSTGVFNLMVRKGADRLAANNKGETMLGLIEKDKEWDWDAEGFLKLKQQCFGHQQ
jgi:ankyrin repeat protein